MLLQPDPTPHWHRVHVRKQRNRSTWFGCGTRIRLIIRNAALTAYLHRTHKPTWLCQSQIAEDDEDDLELYNSEVMNPRENPYTKDLNLVYV